jgi:hypothetical protein
LHEPRTGSDDILKNMASQDHLSPGARQVVHPDMTPCDQAHALNQQQMPADAVKSLAHGLPEHKSVQWAAASAEKVSNPAHPTDMQAIHAAKAWTQNPNPTTQKAAALAASKTDFKTPGAWAAQAAAWSGSGAGLTAHAVSGSVMLAAAQGGKPIAPPGAATPTAAAPKIPAISKPAAPRFQLPCFKKSPVPEVPQVPTKGADGLTLTPAQRAEMAKNTDPFLKLGCNISQSRP